MLLALLLHLLICLCLTVTAEGLVMRLLSRSWRFVYYSLLVNLLTNPALNVLLTAAASLLGASAYIPALIVLELLALAVEALVYRRLCDYSTGKAFAVSALLNAVSFALGLAFFAAFPGL